MFLPCRNHPLLTRWVAVAARPSLRPRTMASDPFALFDEWFPAARESEPNDPRRWRSPLAAAGEPSARMVLLKGTAATASSFTQRAQREGWRARANPNAALLFHWKSLRRQVRIGAGGRVGEAEADAYFASRGRDSQLGAWASDQSRPLDARRSFERRFEEAKRRFNGVDVPRPPHWGGYRVVPERIEFWSDRPHRLHERRLFVPTAGAGAGLLYP